MTFVENHTLIAKSESLNTIGMMDFIKRSFEDSMKIPLFLAQVRRDKKNNAPQSRTSFIQL